MLEILFLISLIVVLYTYVGYAAIIWILVIIKRLFVAKPQGLNLDTANLPEVCLFVTAYNEIEVARQKVENSFKLNYPKDKIQYLWMTDGSTDGTPEFLRQFPELQVEHTPERLGKIHAMNRGLAFVKTPLVMFSDSNTILGEQSIMEIVRQFQNPSVGCVAGEKRILEKDEDSAAASGEGFYWKLESFIKRMDAEFSSAVGAAGELFAIRTDLFKPVEPDTILDDFIISLRIAESGYRVAYTPNAYAVESASASVKEELKRKIRIAAGGLQTIFRLPQLLNPFRNGWLSFQYISHKILRWTIAPFALFAIFLINLLILLKNNTFDIDNFYAVFLYFQLILYVVAAIGWQSENKQIRFKFFFIPYYFVAMNYASIKGIVRYFKGKQSVVWEKSKRAKV
jgi:cellulose synthase/poly-beta-1,6-N-acetylglucosamine synthase-like glycosyltransferase